MKRFAEGLLILFFVLICGLTVLNTAEIVYHHHQEEQQRQEERDTQGGWKPPTIPECDLPLWERIKDRCGKDIKFVGVYKK